MKPTAIIRFVNKWVLARLNNSLSLQVKYLNIAKFIANFSINPPLTQSHKKIESKWINQGGVNSDKSPREYLELDDSVKKLFENVLPLLDTDSKILEIGCNTGRSLEYLYRKGFRNLTGIEIGVNALDSFQNNYNDAFRSTKIICGNAVNEINSLDSDYYDLVFAHSVLVNISPHDNIIFRELCRVSKGYILTIESEGSWTTYPRNFEYLFNNVNK